MKGLRTQVRVAASLLKVGKSRVKIKPDKVKEVSEAITREDVKRLIVKGVIYKGEEKGVSRGRWRVVKEQKKKGRRKGHGSRKGAKKARTPKKRAWINKVRSQRVLLKALKGKGLISNEVFKSLYSKVKSGFFRDKRHIKTYITDHDLIVRKK